MSKGMMLIEAFRAERLRQRQALRDKACTPGAAQEDGSLAEAQAGAVDDLPVTAGRNAPTEHGAAAACSNGSRALVGYEPPLAEIGVGPGMLMRLRQLGFHTIRDLAATDPATLRAGLGEISRLLDVESWIATARRKLQPSSAG